MNWLCRQHIHRPYQAGPLNYPSTARTVSSWFKNWTSEKPIQLRDIDAFLMNHNDRSHLTGLNRFITEFWFFGLKQVRACLFAGLFFAAVILIPQTGMLGVARYDALLIVAVLIQAWMLWAKLETVDELKAICIFHAVGFALEAFKTSGEIQAWSYPDFAYTKLFNVPLFSGFMYAAVGSYIIQAWRLFDLRIRHYPPYWLATISACAIYGNFFTLHYIGDYRWYLAAFTLGLYARCIVSYVPLDRVRKMPLLLSFMLIGFFVWVAENVSTFFSIWKYPNQEEAWAAVEIGKWGSWALLIVMTITIVAQLKHVKKTIFIPK